MLDRGVGVNGTVLGLTLLGFGLCFLCVFICLAECLYMYMYSTKVTHQLFCGFSFLHRSMYVCVCSSHKVCVCISTDFESPYWSEQKARIVLKNKDNVTLVSS